MSTRRVEQLVLSFVSRLTGEQETSLRRAWTATAAAVRIPPQKLATKMLGWSVKIFGIPRASLLHGSLTPSCTDMLEPGLCTSWLLVVPRKFLHVGDR